MAAGSSEQDSNQLSTDEDREAQDGGGISEQGEMDEANEGEGKAVEVDLNFKSNFHKMSEEIDRFVSSASSGVGEGSPPEIPDSVERFAEMVEGEILKYDSDKESGKWAREFCSGDDCRTLLLAIDKVVILTNVLQRYASEPNFVSPINRTSSLLERAMAFLEEEFRGLLGDSSGSGASSDPEPSSAQDSKTTAKQPAAADQSNAPTQEAEKNSSPENDSSGDAVPEEEINNFPGYPPEIVSTLNSITKAMISAGYESECLQAYGLARSNLLEDCLSKEGLERVATEEVLKMSWDALEGEILSQTKVCKLCLKLYFSSEKSLCEAVFSGSGVSAGAHLRIYTSLARGIVYQFLNFAEAVALTRKTSERLFKVLDIYETLRNLSESVDGVFQEGDDSSTLEELKFETSSIYNRIGKNSVLIFSDVENSIRSEGGKTAIPGGAVHPMTRHAMNYLHYACEYKEALERAFWEHPRGEYKSSEETASEGEEEHPTTPFARQVMVVLDRLGSGLNAKSKLYKDHSLSSIFLLNNTQYMMQKIKAAPEINDALDPTWRRKQSADLRLYHKNYQRETWGKVLAQFKDDGLMHGRGIIIKPLLKERFRNFNAMIEEIHRTQSAWVVADEQLQSELRISILAVVIPAYRSFLGRYKQYFTPGRQTEKYVKYGAEELEESIDDLFGGAPASLVKRW